MKIINLNIIINAIMNVIYIHIQYYKINIYAQIQSQKIIILIKMIIFTKNVIIYVKNVVLWEMKIITIAMNV